MKKNIITKTLVLLILVSFAFSPLVAAQVSNTLTFDELGLSLNSPAGYYVLTEKSEKDNPVFAEFGYDYDETIEMFYDSDLYFWAINSNFTQSIYFSAIEDSSTDYSLYDDQDLDAIFNDYKGRFSEDILIYTDYFIIETEQYKFLAMLYEFTDGSEINGIDIVTISNGYSMSFELYSYTGEPIDNNTINTLVSVVESIDFYYSGNQSSADLDHQLDLEFEMSDESYYAFEPEEFLNSFINENLANNVMTVIVIILAIIASFLLIYFIVLLIGVVVSKNHEPATFEKPVPDISPEQAEQIDPVILPEQAEQNQDGDEQLSLQTSEQTMLAKTSQSEETSVTSNILDRFDISDTYDAFDASDASDTLD